MRKSSIYLIHLGFWITYVLFLFVMVAGITQGFSSGPKLGYLLKLGLPFVVLPSIMVFYLVYVYVFPKYIKTRKIGLSLLFGILISVASALLASVLINVLFGTKIMFVEGFTTFAQEIGVMTLIGFVIGMMSVIIKGFITWFTEIKLNEALNLKNHQIELALVKSHLDPHFLFNTINNIDVLILKSPQLASEYLNKLSDILRFMLFETKTDKIPLSKEIEYIEKYIALQKIRTSNDNFVRFTVSGETTKQTIPAMLLIPYIENAFKHVSNKKTENAITISLLVEAKKIVFECENKYNEHTKSTFESSGLGNELIQKRIEMLYPNKHNLAVQNQNNSYSINLVLYHE